MVRVSGSDQAHRLVHKAQYARFHCRRIFRQLLLQSSPTFPSGASITIQDFTRHCTGIRFSEIVQSLLLHGFDFFWEIKIQPKSSFYFLTFSHVDRQLSTVECVRAEYFRPS